MNNISGIEFVTRICERCGQGFKCLEESTMTICYECNCLNYKILNNKLKEIMQRNPKAFFNALTGEP